MDIDALPEWSGPHKAAKVVSEHEDGTPDRVELTVSAVGISDDQVLDYTWTENTCSWSLVEGQQLSSQEGTYTLSPKGDGTHVKFDLSIELKVKMPGLIVKRAQKMAVDTAKKGLTDEVMRRI